jgi:hypothetical protein
MRSNRRIWPVGVHSISDRLPRGPGCESSLGRGGSTPYPVVLVTLLSATKHHMAWFKGCAICLGQGG